MSAVYPVGLPPTRWRRGDAQHEVVDVALPRRPVAEKHLSDVLEVCRPLRGEGLRVGVLVARVRVVRQLRVLYARPHALLEKVKVGHVLVACRPAGDERCHVGHGVARAAPHAAVERSVVVRVVADRVHELARGDPLLHREPLSRVEPRVRVANNEPVHARVRRDEEAPEHAADLAARRARQLGRRAVHVDHLGAVMPQQPLHVLWHGAVKVHADRPTREDERRKLRVAQHARRVPRVAAVQPEGHDSLLVGRGERVDAQHLLHQRQPARRQPRRVGGERSAHALYSVPPLPHPRRRHGPCGLPPFRVPAQHRPKAQVDVAAARHVV
mmetsp:Transcript_15725/g.50415  ORF Transcript_15725/g.50415 Transcript_15725/m.50415 type:complete len:327 (+) Transcript_15725:102-1082(+)